jgi:hypothetical protein
VLVALSAAPAPAFAVGSANSATVEAAAQQTATAVR